MCEVFLNIDYLVLNKRGWKGLSNKGENVKPKMRMVLGMICGPQILTWTRTQLRVGV